MSSEAQPLHIIFFPFFPPGHTIPIINMAKLFSSRGVKATILTTTVNAPLIEQAIHEANNFKLNLVQLNLPEHLDNFTKAENEAMQLKSFQALESLRDPFAKLLNDLQPDAVVTDLFLPWTADIAFDLGIRRLIFHCVDFFSLSIFDCRNRYNLQENLPSNAKTIVMPGLPHHVEFLISQEPNLLKFHEWADFLRKIAESEEKSYGAVVNTFYELEPEYAEHYRNVIGKKAWAIGPLFLCDKSKHQRGGEEFIKYDKLLNWLDAKEPNSVIYACFGSVGCFTSSQWREIALGLEASNQSFVLVVRQGREVAIDCLPAGYEERVVGGGQGMIVKDWAPQMLILNHPSIGGFLTHCGWGSCLEAISAGVPFITWPFFAEHFYNEKQIVDILKIGISIGVQNYAWKAEERELVKCARIATMMGRLMEGDEEVENMRKRVRALSEAANKAVDEGGSSYLEMDKLIKELLIEKRMRGISKNDV